MNLQKKLAVWQQEKLISSAQGEAIAAFEHRGRKPVLMWSLLALACFCILLGTVSVISANWQEIAPEYKLFLDFALLALTGGYVLKMYREGREIWFEWLLLFFAGLILASIGLIAQIYQIQPEGLRGYLLWAVLAFPVMLFSKRIVLPLVWLPVFMLSLIDALNDMYFFELILGILQKTFPFAISIAGILAFAFIYRLLAVHFRTRLAAQVKAMKFWLVFDISVLVLVMDFGAGDVFGSMFISRLFDNYSWASVIVICGLILGTVGFGYFSYKYNYSRLLTCILAILLGFSLVYNALPENKDVLNIWGFLLSMSVLSCLVAYALIKSRVKLLNLATALMALRFFIVFLQVFGSLLMTGVGLIICGVVFLGIIFAWRKLHLNSLISVKESK